MQALKVNNIKVKEVMVVGCFLQMTKQARRDSVHGDSECARWMNSKCNDNNLVSMRVGEQPVNSRNFSW